MKPRFTRRDRRSDKNTVNNLFKKLRRGSFFEDCNYHVCRVTDKGFSYQDIHGAFVEGVSMFDGHPTSCSITHCAPFPLKEKDALERIEYAKTHTWEEYNKKYIYGENMDVEAFREQQRIWGFREPDFKE